MESGSDGEGQFCEQINELGYEGSYDRVAAFGRRWKLGQMKRVKSASKSTPNSTKGVQTLAWTPYILVLMGGIEPSTY